jgi:hypothetical protein
MPSRSLAARSAFAGFKKELSDIVYQLYINKKTPALERAEAGYGVSD